MGPHGKEPGLVYEASYRARLKPPIPVGLTPFGNRMWFEVIDGAIEGERLNGVLTSGGGDWLLAGPDGFGRLDVRANFTLNDGANLYLQYYGLLELNETVLSAIGNSEGTDFEDHYFRTNPRFETGDDRYAWLNQTLFVAKGHALPGLIVEYDVYRVT
ncbi:MAG TPA: DUF3237 domain-containing protein [Acidimicrobiia bacterium]|nr:DUF3237 domain-containing protein [Acidimicrobiia bacterium]